MAGRPTRRRTRRELNTPGWPLACAGAEGPAYFAAEGARSDREHDGCHVYRVDAGTGEISRVADDFERPNGLAFSIDENKLYISDTGRSHGDELPHHIRVFDVVDGRTLRGGEVFAVCEPGFFDGFRLDEQGNIWTSAGDGVQCFAPDGTLIGKIKLPESCANVCFGMLRNDRLFMTATTSVYAVYLLVRGHRTFSTHRASSPRPSMSARSPGRRRLQTLHEMHLGVCPRTGEGKASP